MAYEQNPYAVKLTVVGDPALTALTGSYLSAAMAKYKLVKLSGTVVGTTVACTAITAATDRPLGILQNSPSVYYNQSSPGTVQGVGEAEVTIAGISKAVVGGATVTLTPSGVSGANITVSSTDSLEVGMTVVNTGASVATTISSITSETVFVVASGTGITTSTALTIGTSGGVISAGDAITVDASGGVAKVRPGIDIDQYIIGTALSAGVTGDVITVVVDCSAAARAA